MTGPTGNPKWLSYIIQAKETHERTMAMIDGTTGWTKIEKEVEMSEEEGGDEEYGKIEMSASSF